MMGMELTLMKRCSSTRSVETANPYPDNINARFTVFGYYDDLFVKVINNMNAFAPQTNDWDLTRSPFASQFPIRIVQPTIADGLIINSNIDYNFLEHLPMYPLLTVIPLSFSKEHMSRFSSVESLKFIINLIKEKIKTTKGVVFSIYYCIGSADYVLLCRSNNFEAAFNALYCLREQDNLLASS